MWKGMRCSKNITSGYTGFPTCKNVEDLVSIVHNLRAQHNIVECDHSHQCLYQCVNWQDWAPARYVIPRHGNVEPWGRIRDEDINFAVLMKE